MSHPPFTVTRVANDVASTSRSASSVFDRPENQRAPAIALDGTTPRSYASRNSADVSDLSLLRNGDSSASRASPTYPPSRPFSTYTPSTTSTTTSKRARMASFGRRLKDGPKRIVMRLDLDKSHDGQMDADGRSLPGITDNPMFNTDEVLDTEPTGVRGLVGKAKSSLKVAANAVAHPKQAAKGHAAMNITVTEEPYLKEDANEKLLEAHEKLEQIQERDGDHSEEEEEARDEIRALETARDQTRDAWVSTRHVRRVMVISTKRIAFPDQRHYYERNRAGRVTRFQWERWAGALMIWYCQDFTMRQMDSSNDLAFDQATLIRHVERILIASAPWQLMFMHIRNVYRWENPRKTFLYLLSYMFLIQINFVGTSAIGYLLYLVIRTRFTRHGIDTLREQHARANDDAQRVLQIPELVKRHGGDNWLEPLLDELGPKIQEQVGDLADFLEVLINFYHWRNPRATFATLSFFAALLLVTASCELSVTYRVFWYCCASFFFGARPIASRFPKYRHVVSPFCWFFWDCPTQAELTLADMQEQADSSLREWERKRSNAERLARSPQKLVASPPSANNKRHRTTATGRIETPAQGTTATTTTPTTRTTTTMTGDETLLSFRARFNGTVGRLVLTPTSLHFQRSGPTSSAILWRRAYADLAELRKLASTGATMLLRLAPTQTLSARWTDGTESVLQGMSRRDEAFNAIVGISGLRWRAQDPVPEMEEEGEEAGEGGKKEGKKEKKKGGRGK